MNSSFQTYWDGFCFVLFFCTFWKKMSAAAIPLTESIMQQESLFIEIVCIALILWDCYTNNFYEKWFLFSPSEWFGCKTKKIIWSMKLYAFKSKYRGLLSAALFSVIPVSHGEPQTENTTRKISEVNESLVLNCTAVLSSIIR